MDSKVISKVCILIVFMTHFIIYNIKTICSKFKLHECFYAVLPYESSDKILCYMALGLMKLSTTDSIIRVANQVSL